MKVGLSVVAADCLLACFLLLLACCPLLCDSSHTLARSALSGADAGWHGESARARRQERDQSRTLLAGAAGRGKHVQAVQLSVGRGESERVGE